MLASMTNDEESEFKSFGYKHVTHLVSQERRGITSFEIPDEQMRNPKNLVFGWYFASKMMES